MQLGCGVRVPRRHPGPGEEEHADDAAPELVGRGTPLRVWSAGCASGEEAYTVAALWHRFVEGQGESQRLGRVRITASDLDAAALAVAQDAPALAIVAVLEGFAGAFSLFGLQG